MAMEWLGEHEKLIGALMRFGNAYAQNYNTERDLGIGVSFSASEIQALEYILFNERENQHMAEMAAKLGIPNSTFSKNIKKMMDKGLVEKYHTSTNKKEIILRVSAFGREAYGRYRQFVYDNIYKDVFTLLDTVPQEYRETMLKALDMIAKANITTAEPELIPIKN